MRLSPLAIALFCASLVAGPGAGAAPAPKAGVAQGAVVSGKGQLAVRHEKYRLGNGLEVILVEDHRLPLVAFNLWIHAGPRNEAQGQTGFAHLFEHLMFAGTKHLPRGETDKLVDAVGGTDSNGSTNFDRTNYFFTLPSNQLELGLWIKSDMLGYMTDEVDSTALANQQDVVRNERRQRTENQPYGITDEAVYQALFPQGHPYRAVVIGSHADIQSIKLEDVKAFARTYYRPNNATLVLAGDFNPAQARQLLQKYFGALKAGEPVAPVVVAQPVLTGENRVQVTDRVELSRLDIAWHTPAIFKPGDAELDVASSILGEGKASRLYKKLVYEKQLAQTVKAEQSSLSLGSVFSIEAVARAGKPLDEIQALVDAEVAELAKTPPSLEEVQRAVAGIQTRLLQRLEKMTTLADTINSYNQMAGDPDYIGRDLARYRAVTPQAVSATVAALLRKDARVVVQTTPGPQQLAPEVATPPMPTMVVKGEALNADEPWRAQRPAAAKARPLVLPAGKRFALANGLTVVHVPKPGLPLASATLVLRAGQSANPLNQPGLSGFTAAMLQEGTATRSSQQIADQVANLGATLNSASRPEEARVELSSMKANFPQGLALLADVALHPVFAPTEVERIRAARLGALAQQRAQASALVNVVAGQALFGEQHPLGASGLGTPASLEAVSSATLRSFWQAHYRPDQAALVVAGDISEAELRKLTRQLFGAWKRPAAKAVAQLATPHPTVARLVLVDKPGAQQTALSVVALAPLASDPMSADIDVMNAAMGGLFTSRINNQLREVKGYTYGVYSAYALGRDSGLAAIRGSVRTDVTGAALTDMFQEISGMRAQPLGSDEFARVRNAELLALPGLFDTNRAIVNGYAGDWANGLPADSIVKLPAKLAAVTPASAFQAAQAHADPDKFIVVAVGDKAKILPQLQAWGRKPLELRDTSGLVLPMAANP
jgi:zinc protease